MMEKVIAVILAGGRGERLSILTQERTKPAMPFAGKYRIIDFTLSNCVNSGIHNIDVLTQYQPLSLLEHIGVGEPWGLSNRLDGGIRLLQPYLAHEEGRDWYKGTADAVFQNMNNIEEQGADFVLILSGDHIYSMDYSKMLELHLENGADVTLAVTRFPENKLSHFGTVTLDENGQVTGFEEKVKNPQSNLVSMGIYIFKKNILQKWLAEDAHSKKSQHDFGRNLFPRMLGNCKMYAYRFHGYWRDVGTIAAYWEASKDLIDNSLSLLFDKDWPIRTKPEERPPSIFTSTAEASNSLISCGCSIEGRVEHSILSAGVRVEEGAVVRDSVIMNDTLIGRDSIIDHAIIDKEVIVEVKCQVGYGPDFQVNRKEPEALDSGITIVGKRVRIPAWVKVGRNCAIYSGTKPSDFMSTEIKSGETVKPRRKSAQMA